MSALTECIDAWVANDADRIAAAVADGLLVELREYQTTAALYEWQGTWR